MSGFPAGGSWNWMRGGRGERGKIGSVDEQRGAQTGKKWERSWAHSEGEREILALERWEMGDGGSLGKRRYSIKIKR